MNPNRRREHFTGGEYRGGSFNSMSQPRPDPYAFPPLRGGIGISGPTSGGSPGYIQPGGGDPYATTWPGNGPRPRPRSGQTLPGHHAFPFPFAEDANRRRNPPGSMRSSADPATRSPRRPHEDPLRPRRPRQAFGPERAGGPFEGFDGRPLGRDGPGEMHGAYGSGPGGFGARGSPERNGGFGSRRGPGGMEDPFGDVGKVDEGPFGAPPPRRRRRDGLEEIGGDPFRPRRRG